MDRKELIKLLFALQNEAYRKSGLSIDEYPFICFDFCTDAELRAYHFQLGGN